MIPGLVGLHLLKLTYLFLDLPFKSLLFPVLDGGGFFEVFALLPLPDNTFFLYHPLEALNGFFQVLTVVNSDLSYLNHPLFFQR